MDKKAKIVIVDDDPDILEVYSRILEQAGYEVVGASSGQDCLRLVKTERPDLVLLDVMMPGVSGFEVCQQIKADPDLARTCVIYISGLQTSEDSRAEGLDAGADGYLLKPIDPRVLLAHVRAMIRINAAETALTRERELRQLEQLSHSSQTAVTSQAFGVASLRKTVPEVFEELVRRYGELMDLALEQQAYKIEHNVSEGLRALVERLGFLRAGPRDVMEIHATFLKRKTTSAMAPKAQAYLEEGRLRVLELMGYLVSYYRNYALGVRTMPAAAPHPNTLPAGEKTHE